MSGTPLVTRHSPASTASIYRRILKVSMPLVASLGATTVMEFTDRLFLARYSLDAIAAATPAGIMALLAMTIFLGTTSYVSVFVAQYTGQGRPEMVGRVVWQGIYVALFGAAVLAALALLSDHIFALAGHSPEVQELESVYFRVLCLGAGIHLAGGALAGFFTGLGRTRVVMLANVAGMLINIPLDYCLINGVGPFPEMGIFGAGLATVLGWSVITAILWLAMLRREHRRFKLGQDRRLRSELLLRLMRYGLPSGMEFFLDIFAFTVFIFVVGRLGTVELAATNIALNVNALAFMPLVGFAMGTSALVGQAMGAGRQDDVPMVVRASLVLTFAYLTIMSAVFLLAPEAVLGLFQPRDMDPVAFAAVVGMGRTLLMIVVAYLFFDGVSFIVYGALKGAGDTIFVMTSRLVLVILFMIVPILVGARLGFGIYYFWAVSCTFLVMLSLVGWWRFRQGKWRDMLVVEKMPPA
ncbi:MAG: MATE family efflux transporter [Desulfomicrobium sp.]|nr:MATE family efflux transporter [Desulfomicrobium sp.]